MNSTSQCVYPPQALLQTVQDPLVVLQLTDLHLRIGDVNELSSKRALVFQQLLSQALAEQPDCALIVLTGDLIHDMDNSIYDWIFQILETTGIPFVCISGNHDVTDEVGDGLEFYQKELIAYDPDPRLVSNHLVETEFWQILFIDSSVSGKISGNIREETFVWLEQQLTTNTKPAMLCLHHHLLPMQSKWLDEHILLNYQEFWQRMRAFSNLKVTVCGHVHQESCQYYKQVASYSTPATSYQFKPLEDDFVLDTIKPGYRWLFLAQDGTFHSEVKRLKP